jgi:hypothetical protein
MALLLGFLASGSLAGTVAILWCFRAFAPIHGRLRLRSDSLVTEIGMTTSKETEWMNHPRLRKLVTAVNELTLAERITLVKGLVPGIADELSDTEYEKFVAAIRLKGERFHEAQAHPGEGRAERKVPGDRDIEGR